MPFFLINKEEKDILWQKPYRSIPKELKKVFDDCVGLSVVVLTNSVIIGYWDGLVSYITANKTDDPYLFSDIRTAMSRRNKLERNKDSIAVQFNLAWWVHEHVILNPNSPKLSKFYKSGLGFRYPGSISE